MSSKLVSYDEDPHYINQFLYLVEKEVKKLEGMYCTSASPADCLGCSSRMLLNKITKYLKNE